MEELWKEIEEYPNYQISSLGRVKSKPRMGTKGGIINGENRDGYIKVHLCPGGFHFVHRLVAQAFIPNPDNLPVVDHINGDRSDNRVENLRWATYSDNATNLWTHRRIKELEERVRILEEELALLKA